MKEIVYKLLAENGMTENTMKEAMEAIEKNAYKEGYEQGLIDGQKKGVKASIRAINRIENDLSFYTVRS